MSLSNHSLRNELTQLQQRAKYLTSMDREGIVKEICKDNLNEKVFKKISEESINKETTEENNAKANKDGNEEKTKDKTKKTDKKEKGGDVDHKHKDLNNKDQEAKNSLLERLKTIFRREVEFEYKYAIKKLEGIKRKADGKIKECEKLKELTKSNILYVGSRGKGWSRIQQVITNIKHNLKSIFDDYKAGLSPFNPIYIELLDFRRIYENFIQKVETEEEFKNDGSLLHELLNKKEKKTYEKTYEKFLKTKRMILKE